jgi:adenosine deaminase
LHATVLERKDRARHLLFHYAETLSKEPQGLPFQALNILAPTTIEKLKNTFIGKNKNKKIIQQEITWLKKLPKTELHCHLGGIANPGELIEIARAAENKLQKYNEKLANIVKRWQELVDAGKIKVLKRSLFKYKKEKRLKDVFLRLKRELKTPVWAICCSLILVFEKTPDLLTEFIYGNKINEKDFFSVGISEYEALGDLQGSSILQLEETIRKACQILIRKCIDHNVKYIEIRCSPGNYTRAGLTAEKVIKYISEEFEKARPTLFAGLIFIGSRHGKMSDLWRHVELAEDMLKNRKKITVPLVGFDLAGNEKFRADEFTSAFKPLFKRCMHITVHAGETQSAESIWQAVYSLHAERIGHGLKLNNNNYLRKHFLDRNISIELCPSSNFQIVGFKDNFLKSNKKTPIYPLKEYLNIGLEVCINTDNPGISRTDFSNEIHKAARLSPDGLSQWHILKLIKNGFSASFAPHAIRRKLLLEAERDILQFLK